MSLINKVLQDLEARRSGSEPPRPIYEDLRPVHYAASGTIRRRRGWLLAGITAAVVIAAIGGYYTIRLHENGRTPVASGEPRTEVRPASRGDGSEHGTIPKEGMARADADDGPKDEKPPASVPEASAALARTPSAADLPRGEAPMSGGGAPAASRQASSGTHSDSKADATPAAGTAASSAHQLGALARSPLAPAPSTPPPRAIARPRAATPSSSPPPSRTQAAQGDGLVEKKLKPLTPAERAEGHYRHAFALLKQGQAAKAEEELRAALAAHPGYAPARELLAGLLLQRGHAPEAQALLEEGVKLGPEPRLARLLARLLVERGADDAALAVMEAARGAAGRDAEYLSFLATLYQRAGRHAEAIAAYTEAVGLRPADGRSWLGLAISLEAQQQRSEAARAYERALASSGLDGRLRQYAQQRLEKLK